MRAREFILSETQELDEMPLPADWDAKELSADKTFKSRLAYALQRAQRLGAGSSRVAFTIEYEGRPTVLKIAKNAKGMAQNEAEAEVLSDGYVKDLDITIPMIDYDETHRQPVWIHTELAERASEQKLCKIMKCGRSLFHLVGYAQDILGNVNSWDAKQARAHLKTLSDEDAEIFEYYGQKLAELASATTTNLGDFSRAANWGIYKGYPVVIDVGYNDAVKELYWGKL